jgi:hypothetical protein
MELATVKFRHVAIRRGFIRLRPFGARSGQALPWVEKTRLQAGLSGVDQLEPHAQALAGWHDLDKRRGTDLLLSRLDENERVRLQAYERVSDAGDRDRGVATAGGWLLNFSLIKKKICTGRRHLPRLINGPAGGPPARLQHRFGNDRPRSRMGRCRKPSKVCHGALSRYA